MQWMASPSDRTSKEMRWHLSGQRESRRRLRLFQKQPRQQLGWTQMAEEQAGQRAHPALLALVQAQGQPAMQQQEQEQQMLLASVQQPWQRLRQLLLPADLRLQKDCDGCHPEPEPIISET